MNKLEKHISDRKSMLDSFNLRHRIIENSIKMFAGREEASIFKSDLQNFPIMEWVELNDKIKLRRREDLFGDILVFDTIIEEGGEFGKHIHPDCIEQVDVIKGELIDLANNKPYKSGDSMLVEKGVFHIPVSLTHATIRVYFK